MVIDYLLELIVKYVSSYMNDYNLHDETIVIESGNSIDENLLNTVKNTDWNTLKYIVRYTLDIACKNN